MSLLLPYNYDIYIYLCTMNSRVKIIQMHICTDHDNMRNHMVLLFMLDKKVIGISIIEYPPWFKYYDEDYLHYPFCHN